MKKISLLVAFLSLVSCQQTTENSAQAGMSEDTAPALTKELKFMSLINQHRKQMGLKELILDPKLSHLARGHSTNMANQTVSFGHTGFSGRCTEGRIILSGANLCSENVAMGQSSAQRVFQSWLDSPHHRDNMEQDRHTHMGLGYKIGPQGTYYWTQILLEKL